MVHVADGVSLLLVTHDVELVATVADRVAIMRDGALSSAGPTAEMLPTHSPFEPQMAQLFPTHRVITVEQVLDLINDENDN